MKSHSKELLDHAVSAMLGAIEICNKPRFPYRIETFVILAINSWELLLKAKWVYEHKNKLQSLYVRESHKNKNDRQSKKEYIKKNKIKIPFTHTIDWLAKQLHEQKKLNSSVFKNLQGLVEIRDASVHFYTRSQKLNICLYEYGAACVKNFVSALYEWFKHESLELGLHLLPLGFLNFPEQVEAITLNAKESALIKFLNDLDNESNPDTFYSIRVNVEINFTKSKIKDAVSVRTTNDLDALKVRLTEEEIKEKYPLTYETLTQKCKERYSDFKIDKKYHEIRKRLQGNSKFGTIRYLDPNNKKVRKNLSLARIFYVNLINTTSKNQKNS
ncbi:MAG: DUF3644 domain-containing protein [Helicobacteraceae bacterium]|jgi:hypothetical protein|nr:DUF3644 domain-containing protein [Helicobacteraceae bacterium]